MMKVLNNKQYMQFSRFASYLQKLESVSSRNLMTNLLAELIKKLAPEETFFATHLLLGSLEAPYKKIDFNIAERIVLKILAFSFKKDHQTIQALYKKTGDLGDVAYTLSSQDITSTISISNTYKHLKNIALIQGEGSVEKKILLFVKLLNSLDALSKKYVIRIVLGRLRLGFSDMTILDAISVAEVGNKSLRSEIERAYNLSCDIGLITETYKKQGLSGLRAIKITPGIPIRMAGAERLESPEEIFKKLGRCAIEPKYDGFRIQVHKIDKIVMSFSRNLENTSQMFPDIIKTAEALPFKNIIFEGEAVGFDPKKAAFLPFQETIQRKRKHNIEKVAQLIPLKVFVYDILFIENQEVWQKPFHERRKILQEVFKKTSSPVFSLCEQTTANNALQIQQEFNRFINLGLEGLVAKKLNSPYRAGKRSFAWVKFKKSMAQKTVDTFDCVIMGYYAGRGKRTKLGIGAFLVGIYDPDAEEFLSVAKIGTGLSDEEWITLYRTLKKLRLPSRPQNYKVTKELAPNAYVQPKLVVEIGADEITKSPVHKAGFALRFPRFIRLRPDKRPEQATTTKELKHMYLVQTQL